MFNNNRILYLLKFKNKHKVSYINKEQAIKEIAEMKANIVRLEAVVNAPEFTDYKYPVDMKTACLVLGKKNDRLPFPNPEDYHEEATNSYHELTHIIAAIWKIVNVKLETKNANQKKYFYWLQMAKSGVGLSIYDGVYSGVQASTLSGVRLTLPTPEIAKYVVERFIHHYNKLDNQ